MTAPETDWQRIRNRLHVYGSPLSVAKMERVYDLLDLPARPRVLDVGCGKGEVLLRMVERFDARVVGVDPSPVLELARDAAAERAPHADATWIGTGVADAGLEPASFDLTVCMGATHAFGGLDETLAALRDLTRPGGMVLVGEGFWEREPPQEYLDALGFGPDETLHDHAGNVAAAEAAGLRALFAVVASRDEWDEFEWLYRYAMETHRREHGLTPEQERELDARRRFLDAQLRWGRGTLGFGLYLLGRY